MPPHVHDSTAFPAPSVDERAHEERVNKLIRDEVTRSGFVSFSRYMELALYAPGLGYYATGRQKFGGAGDFVTAPESYPLFGRCLARTINGVFEQLGGGDILEAGGGSGALAATILNELDAVDALPRIYYILELSAALRERQALTITQEAPAHFARVRWLERLPEPDFRGVVVANELLDAMPVERFKVDKSSVKQLGVTWDENQFTWAERPAPAAMVERVTPLNLAPGYVSELGFAAEAWVRSLAERIGAGVMLLVDYGFPRAEFYHPDRSTGTLMCHYRHRAHPDPLILAGLQDISAHVDFTAVAQAGTDVGLELLGYASQAEFLLDNGLGDFVRASDPRNVRAHLALTEQIKRLTLPHEMGELYKVIALKRGMNPRLGGFGIHDRRARL